MDRGRDSITPVERQTPLRRSLLRFFPNIILRYWFGDPSEQRQAFESQLNDIEKDINSLIAERNAVLNGEQYLTTTEQRRFRTDIQAVTSEYEDIRSESWPFRYSDEDIKRLSEVRSALQSIGRQVEDYNAEFVERQVKRYDDLFTDIDDDGNGLNREQRRAVVRNDAYNQVIAGAGTGKTLVLTHRIAYLIERGVEPDRIAAITLTNNAADEITDRLAERFDITDVNVKTIHKFATDIAHVDRTGHVDVLNNDQRKNIVKQVIREKTGDSGSDFAWHYRQFLTNYETTASDLEGYESEEDYIRERAELDYKTIAGEEVASRAEKTIADFLFTHGVDYQYEAIAGWANTAEDKGGYYPDFYLPEYDLYIEHWGIDEAGEVAPWFSWSAEKYLEKLHWARSEFAGTEHSLVETYDFEHWAGQLERALEHRLAHHGVALDPMDIDELVEYVLDEHNEKRQIVEQFSKFLANAATFRTTPKQILERLSRSNPREYHFGVCGAMLLTEYELKKAQNDQIDFVDMIYNAVEAVEEQPKRFQSLYDHLLVDEFQDVSISQIELLQTLTDDEDAPNLFCVGDDWQSIYAFRGAVVEYFVDFEEYFGPAAITELRETYRCPETVLSASTDLIANNPEQIEKDPDAYNGRDTTPRLHALDADDDWKYVHRVGKYAADLVEEYTAGKSEPKDVMILSRYDSGANFVNQVKDELENRNIPYDGKQDTFRPGRAPPADSDADGGGVSVFSAHQAKGREAPHVILLHVGEGENGFSPDVRNDELQNVVRDIPANTAAEERRLFYVALTRSKETLDLLTRVGKESPFLDEIDDHVESIAPLSNPGAVGDHLTITAQVTQLWEDTHESQDQAGLLKDATGRIKFVAWQRTDPPTVEEGTWYELTDVKVAEFDGSRELHFTDGTRVSALG
ncbi:UvrD-helicase domain-containing protein [Haloarcula salina]|uniref:UvrD-helicase domain-containing protein n=1 Tax=Haloarcula salina TaxID=1429914 RepID=UPI003C6FE460